MDASFWQKIHGGSTHFPIALIIASLVFDLIGFVLNRDPQSRDLHAASFYALILGALGSLVAVLSGLVIAHWQLFGSGDLARHHDFVWPAFALIIGLAVWRLVVGTRASRASFGVYLAVLAVAAVLMTLAGFWGGEMMLGA